MIASLAELNQQLEALAGGYFDVTVKTNGEYHNTYIEGPSMGGTDVPVPPEEFAAAAVADDDTEPF